MARVSERVVVQRVDRAPDDWRVVVVDDDTGNEVVMSRLEAARVVYVLLNLWGLTVEEGAP